jgi:hypothetical protein
VRLLSPHGGARLGLPHPPPHERCGGCASCSAATPPRSSAGRRVVAAAAAGGRWPSGWGRTAVCATFHCALNAESLIPDNGVL